MTSPRPTPAGSVALLRRYPVKSMQGEDLYDADVTDRGLVGDREYALIEPSTDKIVSAKNPRKWPQLFAFHAVFVEPTGVGQPLPPVRITLPDGTEVTSQQPEVHQVLSAAMGRDVALESRVRTAPAIDEYWPDLDHFPKRDTVTSEFIQPHTFFDGSAVHVLTTATLEHLRQAYPEGQFDACRFRPNIVIATPPGVSGLEEDRWIGHVLAVGDEVRLRIDRPCPRCVMTTLAQRDLPQDAGILRTSVRVNQGNVGVYASVARGGHLRIGDLTWIED